MKQIAFSDLAYLHKRKITKKEYFLSEMQKVVPFARMEAVIEPHHYPKAGAKGGSPPKPLSAMLRVYLLHQELGQGVLSSLV